MAKFKIGQRVIARPMHGKGCKGTVQWVMEDNTNWDGSTSYFYGIKLDSSGMTEDFPETSIEELTEESDLFWVK